MTFCDVNWCFGEMQVTEKIGGPERDRTAGLLVANEALSQHSPLLNQSLPADFPTNNSIQLERKWNVRKPEFASRTQSSEGFKQCTTRLSGQCVFKRRT